MGRIPGVGACAWPPASTNPCCLIVRLQRTELVASCAGKIIQNRVRGARGRLAGLCYHASCWLFFDMGEKGCWLNVAGCWLQDQAARGTSERVRSKRRRGVCGRPSEPDRRLEEVRSAERKREESNLVKVSEGSKLS